MEHASQIIEDEIFDDGARRVRTQVQYDDGLSEDQWLQVRGLSGVSWKFGALNPDCLW